ncbi:LysR family transcriptional regulator [Paraburkholderia guartelaensis]|uniref:LysR family transcriptional regulator n=1 Tax=Paraburkholderia guartelaensis TaxID=2546446 RepID=A0ABU9S547_9BURK
MRKIPNFGLLRAFEAAARLQSFALAARELHLTPSAISHQVKELEAYFGRPIFNRRNRRMDPTPVALRLLDSLSRVPMCSPALLASAGSVEALMQEATLIDSPSSRVTWRDRFAANGLPLTDRPRPLFDRAALAISAAADGMGIVLESTRLAERELARGDLVEVGADRFTRVLRETHFLSCRTTDVKQSRLAAFRQ